MLPEGVTLLQKSCYRRGHEEKQREGVCGSDAEALPPSKALGEGTAVGGVHRRDRVSPQVGHPPAGGRDRTTQPGTPGGGPRRYGPEVAQALRRVWEAANRPCGKRLAPFLPDLVAALERHGELALPPAVRASLLQMSASTIDRLLRPFRQGTARRPLGATKPGTLLKAAIPIRTFSEWDERRPGFLEVDLVAHGGESTEGFYLNTLSAVDIATGWVEVQGVWGKGQDRVGSAIHTLRQRLPFPLLGLDSDNGSEFINHHLYAYCLREHITFTRSRPYKKNDSAHVEQKNWHVVRRLVGYDRYTSREALLQLNRLYRPLRLYMNFFQPVLQLQGKHRIGARVRKTYDTAKTPYQRLLASGVLTTEQEAALQELYLGLNPVQLLAQIQRDLDLLWKLATTERHTPSVTVSSEATIPLR